MTGEPAAVHDLVVATSVEHGGRHRLRLSGELDLASAPALTDAVAEACGARAKEIVLDIGELEFIDSTGLRAILSSRVVCAESNCALSVHPEADRVSPQVRRLLQVTGLLERLPFADADADADAVAGEETPGPARGENATGGDAT
jgi:anti-anti-sigma factor